MNKENEFENARASIGILHENDAMSEDDEEPAPPSPVSDDAYYWTSL
jgi:hypothetical protein